MGLGVSDPIDARASVRSAVGVRDCRKRVALGVQSGRTKKTPVKLRRLGVAAPLVSHSCLTWYVPSLAEEGIL